MECDLLSTLKLPKKAKMKQQPLWEDQKLQHAHERLLHKKEAPKEGFAVLPIGLLFLFCGLVFWAGVYLIHHSGAFRPDIYDPNWKPGAQSEMVAAVFDPIEYGKKAYKKNCQQCHQASGEGIPGVYPPLVQSSWVLSDPGLPIKIILLGLEGPITVKGETYNNAMAGLGQLKDRDIAAILTYVRQAWGNAASPVDEEQVTAIRNEVGGRTTACSAEELLEEYPLGSGQE